MDMFIFTPDLSNYHEVKNAISVRTKAVYDNVGLFSMALPIDDYNLKIAENNSIVYDKKSGRSYVIVNKKIETAKNTITVNGYSSEWLLTKRVILQPKGYPATEQGIYQIITDNLRGLPVELAEIKGLGGSGNLYAKEGQLLNAVIQMAQMNNFGIRMNFNPHTKKFTFEVYKGEDLTKGLKAQIFSYERGTAQALTINQDVSFDYSRFIVFGYVNNVKYTETYDTGGLGSEKVLDGGFIGFDNGSGSVPQDIIDSFKASLKSKAESAAKSYTNRQSFTVEVSAEEFGTAYKLGDIVTCNSTKFAVKFNKRITSAEFTMDANGRKTKLTLGEPELTKTEADRLNGRN